MATPPRLIVTGELYHIYNRGIRKQPIFQEKKEYIRFLRNFEDLILEHLVSVFAYCLMKNHFHFLVRQDIDGAISHLFSRLCNSQAKYFNIKYELVGPLFQGRFKAKLVDKDAYFLHLTRYIHLNPAEMSPTSDKRTINRFIEHYPWSSYRDYLDPSTAAFTKVQEAYKTLMPFKTPDHYRSFVSDGIRKIPTEISHLIFE